MRRPRLKPCAILAWAWCLGMSLGSPLMAAPLALPEAIRAKLAEHPSLNARPFDIQWSALQRSGPCDQWEIDLPPRPRLLGALRVPVRCPSNPRLNQTATLNVSLMVPVLVAARDHPLAARGTIPFAEVLGHDLVGLDRRSAISRFLVAQAVREGRPIRLRVQLRGRSEEHTSELQSH